MICFSTFPDFPCSNIISVKPFVTALYKIATFSLFFAVFASISSILRRRQWHPTPVLLPGKSCGRRSLVGCSPWGREESDRTEQLHFHFSLSCIREGNSNPLQCSCLENPRDGGAWWAAVSGVAQCTSIVVRTLLSIVGRWPMFSMPRQRLPSSNKASTAYTPRLGIN